MSPILTIQRRMAEQGRIRLGEKAGGNGRPVKLETFRLTSPNERLIRQAAELYGGTPQPWTVEKRAEWQVTTDATSLPVIVVKGGVSQWMEQWSKGGCTVRCDGEQMQPGKGRPGGPCRCAAMPDGADIPCKPTTRLSVMLRDVETLGVFRLESKGWSAAAELPGPAELAAQFGDLVPATLHLVKRKAISEGKTREFMVPVLDLEVSKARLVAIAAAQAGGGATAQLEQQQQPTAIEAAPVTAPTLDYARGIADAMDETKLQQIYDYAQHHGHLTDAIADAIEARVDELRGHGMQPAPDTTAPEADAMGADPEVETLWYQVQVVAGKKKMTSGDVQQLAESMGITPATATVEKLQQLHDAITTGEVPS